MTPQEQLDQHVAKLWNQALLEKLLPKLPLWGEAVPTPRRRISYAMQELIGKTVTAVWLDPEHERLVFETDQGNVAYRTEGDCCSYSYFNDIIGLDALLGHMVNSAESVDMPEVAADNDYDVIDAYGIKLSTNRGYTDIVFRNVSNGYYGGYCALDPWTTIDEQMIKLTGPDWSRDA